VSYSEWSPSEIVGSSAIKLTEILEMIKIIIKFIRKIIYKNNKKLFEKLL